MWELALAQHAVQIAAQVALWRPSNLQEYLYAYTDAVFVFLHLKQVLLGTISLK